MTGIAIILLGFGVGNIVGTYMSGAMVQRSLRLTLGLVPLFMAGLATGLVIFGGSKPVAALLVAAWGFAFGAVPVAWTTWLTKTVPDETESGGGLQVAAIQTAIAAGAGIGGLLLDVHGPLGAFIGSGAVLLLAAGSIVFSLRPRFA